jgi:hypothetical protein
MTWLLNNAGLIHSATCDLPYYAVVPILLHSQDMQVRYIGLNFVHSIWYKFNALHSLGCK